MGQLILRKTVKISLLVFNSILALLFFLSTYGTRISTHWIIGLFTLGSFYLFLINIGFMIFWFFAKPKLSLLSGCMLLICWYPMSNVFRISFAGDFKMEKNEKGLRVMSWNVEHFDLLEHKTHPETKAAMLSLIRTYNPDVACFQEMVAGEDNSNTINTVKDISHEIGMPYYHYSFDPKLDFDPYHHFGIIIFSKFPIIHPETIIPEKKNYNSIFQHADVVVHNDTFRIFNIHLQSLRFSQDNKHYLNNPSLNESDDIQESKSILKKFRAGFIKRKWQSDNVKREMKKSPYPIILCGDFNDVPNSYAYNNIGEGMLNAFEEKGSGIGATYSSISSTLRIDNIFVSPVFEVQQYTRVKKLLSDHYPVIADIKKK